MEQQEPIQEPIQEPKKDGRAGNAGRKPAKDPTEHLNLYVAGSKIKALGGRRKVVEACYQYITDTANLRIAQKALNAKPKKAARKKNK